MPMELQIQDLMGHLILGRKAAISNLSAGQPPSPLQWELRVRAGRQALRGTTGGSNSHRSSPILNDGNGPSTRADLGAVRFAPMAFGDIGQISAVQGL